MEDTIAAVATAYGEGGIGIIRISGENSLSILKEVFDPAADNKEITSRRMTYGKIIDKDADQIIDEVLAVYMKGPKTYTAEDVVEINCHGSMVSLRKTLALVLRKGARLAEPGEFTKRAFLNGRLDLSQAEAVIDVIKAKTDKSFDVALSQLEGTLSTKISEIRARLLDLLVDITVNIDYPDEDIEYITYEKLEKNISSIGEMIEKLLSTASTGRMIREGIRVAIVGKPNVGKSSLMNGLLKETRAIVTEVPGTTRDTIEEAISIRNIPVYLVDTAGIRETDDMVEKIGIEAALKRLDTADLCLAVFDCSVKPTKDDIELIEKIKNKHTLLVLNKNDLVDATNNYYENCSVPFVRLSALTGEGEKDLVNAITELLKLNELDQNAEILSNERQYNTVLRASISIKEAINAIVGGVTLDAVGILIDDALAALLELDGKSITKEGADEVFRNFCVGK